jgi:hypothetical protein
MEEKALTIRCRVKGCGFQWTYVHDSPTTILRILEQRGWRFVQRGCKSLPVCPKHYQPRKPE